MMSVWALSLCRLRGRRRDADRHRRVKDGGFEVTVAGSAYGKGSSRESSPLAEKEAGIRLIVAENFERIYRQNCDNIGILTTTDFSSSTASRRRGDPAGGVPPSAATR